MIPKTLVISDLHLTDKFDTKKYLFLKKLISDFDQVIINGDLWCVLTNTFDEFINSDWRRLFPLLKSKKTIYINGNHDAKKFTNRRVFEFCDQCLSKYTLSDPPYTFHIEHGPRLTKQKYPLSKIYLRTYHTLKIQRFIYLLQTLAFTLFGYNLIKIFNKSYNNLLRRLAKKLPRNHFLVTGHTHLPEFDRKNKFINTGFIGEGQANYLAIWGDTFDLITTRY